MKDDDQKNLGEIDSLIEQAQENIRTEQSNSKFNEEMHQDTPAMHRQVDEIWESIFGPEGQWSVIHIKE